MTSHWHADLLARCVGANIIVAHDAERREGHTWFVRVDGVRPKVLFSGRLGGSDLSNAVDSIESVSAVWFGEVKRSFSRGTYRLLWTSPPAPFQLYGRKRRIVFSGVDGLAVERRSGRLTQMPFRDIQSVESWISPSGFFAGVSLVLADSKELLVRLLNLDAVAGVVDVVPYNQWGVEFIDAVAWAGCLGRRLASVCDVPWAFFDPNYIYDEDR